jgi:hypothetical protein
VSHFLSSKLHENGFAGSGIPFDPEKTSWLVHPVFVLWIIEEPPTGVYCRMNVIESPVLFSKEK